MIDKCLLRELALEEWVKLRELFKINWPRHVLPFLTIVNYERLKIDKKSDCKILCLDGDWSDGTFILQDDKYMSIYTLQPSCERLYTALKLFDWSLGPELQAYDIALKNAFDRVRRELKLQIRTGEGFQGELPSTLYWMSKEKSSQLDDTTPEDCEIRNLTDSDSTLINRHWLHGTVESESYIKLMIANNPTRGLYGKENGDLRSWALSRNNGILFALQTTPEHLRKGYGGIIVKSMAKFKARLGQDIVACVLPQNIESDNLFKKLKFTPTESKYWIRIEPFECINAQSKI